MAKTDKQGSNTNRKRPPARTPEARENQMIMYAIDLAEQQLRDGTASSQVITHYLKLGSTKERLEKENLARDIELKRAKTEAIQASKDVEKLLAPIDSAVVVANSNLLEDEGEASPRARGALRTEHWVRA